MFLTASCFRVDKKTFVSQPCLAHVGPYARIWGLRHRNGSRIVLLPDTMVRLEITTVIAAPIQRCFDLSRSIDLQVDSAHGTGERAVAGVTGGLIGMGQEVTWKARQFGFDVRHTSRITAFDSPFYFQDLMQRGVFKSYCHDHHFEVWKSGTTMLDVVEFEAPLGLLGRLAEKFVIKRRMQKLLERRNAFIKQTAEAAQWRKYLG
ncbi:MAG TPA: SRPBCC family protein [Terriglobales bacterium]|nr:SRPBCC family protein [Terriglobales bacterium]